MLVASKLYSLLLKRNFLFYCGGTYGYEDFCEAINNPKHPEHESMKEWAGDGTWPDGFKPEEVNPWLAAYAETLPKPKKKTANNGSGKTAEKSVPRNPLVCPADSGRTLSKR